MRSLAALPRINTAATLLLLSLWKEHIRDTRQANNYTLPPSPTSLHQQSLLHKSFLAASCYRLWPCFFALPPWTLRANARVLVITQLSATGAPARSKATVQHFCTTFQLSTVARQGSPPRNSEASTPTLPQGFCVSSSSKRKRCILTGTILVQLL